MWPIKERENRHTGRVVAKSISLKLSRYGSLVNINLSGSIVASVSKAKRRSYFWVSLLQDRDLILLYTFSSDRNRKGEVV